MRPEPEPEFEISGAIPNGMGGDGMVALLAWFELESCNEGNVPSGRYYLHVRAADVVSFEAGEDVPVFIKLPDHSFHEVGVVHEDEEKA